MALKKLSAEGWFAYQQNQAVLALQQKTIVRETVKAAAESKEAREKRLEQERTRRLSTVG